jgi:hypothetical protein
MCVKDYTFSPSGNVYSAAGLIIGGAVMFGSPTKWGPFRRALPLAVLGGSGVVMDGYNTHVTCTERCQIQFIPGKLVDEDAGPKSKKK